VQSRTFQIQTGVSDAPDRYRFSLKGFQSPPLQPPLRIPPIGAGGAASKWSASICGIEREKKMKDGRHVGLDFYDLLIEGV